MHPCLYNNSQYRFLPLKYQKWEGQKNNRFQGAGGEGEFGVEKGEIKGQLPKMLENGVLNNKILSISKMLKMSPYKGK